jgi:uncharacterized membrane protein
METKSVNMNDSKTLLFIILSSLAIFCLVVFLDIPLARQAFGFVYLTFIPGFIFVKILNLGKSNGAETVLFSVGFSVAFLMIAGLFINELSLLFGFSEPLSVVPLMIVLNSLVLIGGVSVYLIRKDVQLWNSTDLKKSPFTVIFLCLPILSIIGAICVNVYSNNLLLLFLIVAIASLLVFAALSKKLLPSNLYSFAVLMIAIALLFHSSLISSYIISFGSDVPAEYFIFQTVHNSASWNATFPPLGEMVLGRFNDMLSITILPTIYANTLNIDAQLVFKILFPLIFAFVPLGLYQIWQTYISKKYAFIAAFLFMAQSTFYTEMFGLNRQIIAELFFVLLLLVIVQKKIKPVNKVLCFIVFSFALVTSHYAIATIFLCFISFAAILLIVLKRPSKRITLTMVALFFVIMFTWYIYVSGAATFESILEKLDSVAGQLGNFFDLSSRGETILTGLGLAESPSVLNTVSRMFAYLTQGLIVLGFVALFTKHKRINLEKEYFIFTITAVIALGMLIAVPGLAGTFNMTRFYHVLLFFLAPLCVVGAGLIVKMLSGREKEMVVCALLVLVLVPYFLFQTSFLYEVTGSDSWSVSLSKYRMDGTRLYAHYGYTEEYSIAGTEWLSKNVDIRNSPVYADGRTIANVLTIHGLIYGGYVNSLSNGTILTANSIVYLSYVNVVEDVIPWGEFKWNTSELAFSFDDLNKIYANGGSEIYQKTS